jgi:DNA (cytosine-5)-methyltransferase 1
MAQVDYPATLAEAWAQHKAPREDNAPTVISTFAGCGGSSLGYSMAGYREVLAVEWDDNAVATFRLNFPEVPVYHGDIAKLTVEECMSLAGLSGPRELDVLDGSPPCQGFSTAGKREIDDDRNQLFREFVRLLRGLQPRVFIMENVSGMVKGKMKLIFAEVMRELRASGYKVSCRLMNAMYFQVPQSRERLIFVGVREDLGREPRHPEAEARVLGIREIIPDARASRSMKINPWIRHPRAAATITKTDSDYQLLSDGGIRKPGISEIARLASYPEGFLWRKDAWARIGNSVPPLFMRAIARHVRETILEADMGLEPVLTESKAEKW